MKSPIDLGNSLKRDIRGIPVITEHKTVWHEFNLEKATCKVCGYFHLLDVGDEDAPEPLCDDCWQLYCPYFLYTHYQLSSIVLEEIELEGR